MSVLAFIENPNLLIKEYNDMVDIAQVKAYITVGVEIQEEEIETIQSYREELSNLKKSYVERNMENEANLAFCVDVSLRMVQHELQMLVCIKRDTMDAAWNHLVRAQVDCETVARVCSFAGESLVGYREKLAGYEKILFPKMQFHSVGGVVRKSTCSVCKSDYGECDHEKGKLYFGELCVREIHEMELEEGSIVENPSNKHCRILCFERNGIRTDILTLRQTSVEDEQPI